MRVSSRGRKGTATIECTVRVAVYVSPATLGRVVVATVQILCGAVVTDRGVGTFQYAITPGGYLASVGVRRRYLYIGGTKTFSLSGVREGSRFFAGAATVGASSFVEEVRYISGAPFSSFLRIRRYSGAGSGRS